jgi:chemotaxis protein histidine kinase CheA
MSKKAERILRTRLKKRKAAKKLRKAPKAKKPKTAKAKKPRKAPKAKAAKKTPKAKKAKLAKVKAKKVAVKKAVKMAKAAKKHAVTIAKTAAKAAAKAAKKAARKAKSAKKSVKKSVKKAAVVAKKASKKAAKKAKLAKVKAKAVAKKVAAKVAAKKVAVKTAVAAAAKPAPAPSKPTLKIVPKAKGGAVPGWPAKINDRTLELAKIVMEKAGDKDIGAKICGRRPESRKAAVKQLLGGSHGDGKKVITSDAGGINFEGYGKGKERLTYAELLKYAVYLTEGPKRPSWLSSVIDVMKRKSQAKTVKEYIATAKLLKKQLGREATTDEVATIMLPGWVKAPAAAAAN